MKKPFLGFIKDFFDFSQKEMNGFVVMASIMIIVITATIVYDWYSAKENIVNTKDQQILDSLLAEIVKNKIEPKRNYNSESKDKANSEKSIEFFHFDPNLASVNEFVTLGLKPFLAERIIKYRSKGGKFKIKSDLLKIYGFPKDKFDELESYIDLPEIKAIEQKKGTTSKSNFESNQPKNYSPNPIKEFKKQDLNLADSNSLEKVYGVGFKLAARIIKYREKLGGFISINQLTEVWGLDSTVIQEINKKFEIANGFQPKKINANSDDFQLLKSHPYIGYNKAKLILNYRKMHGTYHGIDQLKMIQTISAEDIEKIKPYLEF